MDARDPNDDYDFSATKSSAMFRDSTEINSCQNEKNLLYSSAIVNTPYFLMIVAFQTIFKITHFTIETVDYEHFTFLPKQKDK